MNQKLIHTPEGVRDVYTTECQQKRFVMKQLRKVMNVYNYDEIETPSFEYFDVFSQEKGTAKSVEMYKFFDRENNTLVLRPDMTPSIARCVAKYFANEKHHIRLWYQGQAFKNYSRLQGKLHEATQLGAEMIGDDTSAADGEMISMVVDCFLSIGLKEFQVSVGHVDYFKGLVEEAGLDADTEEELRASIQNKNAFAIEKICKDKNVNETLSNAFISLTSVFVDADMLAKAKATVSNARSLKAIERLEKLYQIMEYYGYQDYVGFDLGLLSNYDYYTGVIFRGYTYGSGTPVVSGGRYNGLVKQFGVDTPSVGFAFLVDELLFALQHQKFQFDIKKKADMVLYMVDYEKSAIELAKELRSKNQSIQLTRKSSRSSVEEYVEHCKKHDIQHIYYFKEHANEVTVIDVATGAQANKPVVEL